MSRRTRDVADVIPRLAVVQGVVNLTIAADGPDHAPLDLGYGEVADGGRGQRNAATSGLCLRLWLRRGLLVRAVPGFRLRWRLCLRLWGFRLFRTTSHLRRTFGRSQVRRCGREGMSAVARDEEALVRNVESAGLKGNVELLLEVAAGDVLVASVPKLGATFCHCPVDISILIMPLPPRPDHSRRHRGCLGSWDPA